jgi:hypothetical protein
MQGALSIILSISQRGGVSPYYVSQAALQGDKSKAGSIVRVPAAEVEALVTEAVGKLPPDPVASQTDIRDLIDRVVIGR